jgi:ABC-type phosphate transport system substrate-binding protein
MKLTTVIFAASFFATCTFSAFAGGVVAITNKSLTIDKADIGKVYRGDLSGFKAFDLPEGNASRTAFADAYTGKSAAALKKTQDQNVFAGRSLPPKVLDSAADMVKTVSSTPNGIGYVPESAADESVRVVK